MNEILYELIGLSAQVTKSFISSIQAFNDGNLQLCQKHTKEGQNLLKTMKHDVFEEYFELGDFDKNTNEYGQATQEELILQTANLQYAIGILLSLENGDSDIFAKKMKEKIATAINTIIDLYDNLFEN